MSFHHRCGTHCGPFTLEKKPCFENSKRQAEVNQKKPPNAKGGVEMERNGDNMGIKNPWQNLGTEIYNSCCDFVYIISFIFLGIQSPSESGNGT